MDPKHLLKGLICTGLSLALVMTPVSVLAQPVGLPSLGASSSSELSPALERTLGDAIMEQGRHDPDYIADLDINQYLTQLGRRLAAQAPQTIDQRITVFPVRDPRINAFALPGGYIGINSGMIVSSGTESELAGVLAHEIGHVMQRHIARGIAQQSQGTGIMVATLVGALLAALAGQGDLAMGVATFGQAAAIDRQLGFSRSAEQEADRAGFQMARKAGFDVRGMVTMFQRLSTASRLNEGTGGGGYASTHPLSIQRMSDIENRVRETPVQAHEDSAAYWFARSHLAIIQARDMNDRQRVRLSLQRDAQNERGVRRAAAWYGLALLAWEKKDYAGVRTALDEAAKDAQAPQLDMLAVKLQQRTQPAQAQVAAQAAWARWPDSQGMAVTLAQAMQAVRQDKQVVAFLQARIKQWPEVSEFKKLLADSYERLGERVQAHLAMADYYEQTGALPTAVELLQQARQLDGDFYTQSEIDMRVRALRDRMDDKRALLEQFKS
ncbi:M48 family metalloprotease [Alcaligenaceae bacterium CGII-47]|nr:M48 family metalloprotease [Alcaligenaceae bacterium CGII-47]